MYSYCCPFYLRISFVLLAEAIYEIAFFIIVFNGGDYFGSMRRCIYTILKQIICI